MSGPRWPVEVQVQVAWGEMDSFQHVNNTVFLRWFETARIAYFMKLELPTRAGGSDAGPILARAAVDYRQPVTYPDTITVRASITKVGTTSFNMQYQALSPTLGVVADGDSVIVMYDYKKGTKVPVSEAVRARIAQLEG